MSIVFIIIIALIFAPTFIIAPIDILYSLIAKRYFFIGRDRYAEYKARQYEKSLSEKERLLYRYKNSTAEQKEVLRKEVQQRLNAMDVQTDLSDNLINNPRPTATMALKPIANAAETHAVSDSISADNYLGRTSTLDVTREQKRDVIRGIARKESNRQILKTVFKIDGGRRHNTYSAYIDDIRSQLQAMRKDGAI